MRTQVAIVGAGPAGLTLAQLLYREGVESVVLEDRSRDYVEHRIRAGVLEQGTTDLLVDAGVGERMQREGIVHHGIELQFDGERHRIPLSELTGGRTITIYGQTEVVKDLIAARLDAVSRCSSRCPTSPSTISSRSGRESAFGTTARSTSSSATSSPAVTATTAVCRPSIPAGVLRESARDYPFGWLGILAAVAPSSDELVYAHSPRGFALLSLRNPELSRLYIQCRPDEDLGEWPDDRIWEELQLRLGLDGWTLAEGPVLEKGVTGMRSYVAEPMRYGRLFLVGDAAHIVPPTGAKGLNLALHDAGLLAEAVVSWYRTGRPDLLDAYSGTCLRRVWRAEHFSWWMTSMLHRAEDDDDFGLELQLAQLRYVTTSSAAATSLAENYVGLEF